LSSGPTAFKKQPLAKNTISAYPYQRLSGSVPTYLLAYLRAHSWVLFLALLWTLFGGQASASDSFRIVSQNMYRLFDDINNGKKYETVLSTKKFHEKTKLAAKKIVTDFELPDIMALQEVENINTLNQIIHFIRQTSSVQYNAVLKEGNDVSGMDIGFLIKAEFRVKSVKQLFKKTKLTLNNTPLFSRPPLLIQVCKQSNCISILNLHLRSMLGIRAKSKGHRVRIKRLQQATIIARWVDQYQRTHQGQSLMVLGDFNALSPPDQYIDVVGTIIGRPDNRNTKLSSQNLIQNDLIDLTQCIPHKKRYSYIHKKKKQLIDYMLVNQRLKPRLERIRFSEIDYRFSDHAALIADFSWQVHSVNALGKLAD
jgi:endonuclease/exonuclease/phosphatase family metal-dependent hydrolase